MCRALAVIASVLLLALELPAEALHLENAIFVPAGLLIGYTAVSPAGNVVAALCGGQRVRLWDVSSGKVLQTLDVAERESLLLPLVLHSAACGGCVPDRQNLPD